MRRLFSRAVLVALLAFPAHALADDNVFRTVPGNPADKLAKLPIDSYSYDEATRCLNHPQKGMLAVQDWMEKHAGGGPGGIRGRVRGGKHSASLHAEGRALDWRLDVHNGGDRPEAARLI